ncbi:c-type cytochrome [Paenibacillus sp. CMAA1364]
MQKYIMSGFFFTACILAIVLMFTLPGQGDVDKVAKPTMPEVVLDPSAAETLVKASCISCHGDQLEGSVGPSLQNIGTKMSPEAIYSIINKGKGIMPGFKDTLAEEEVANVAQWLAQKK